MWNRRTGEVPFFLDEFKPGYNSSTTTAKITEYAKRD